MPSSLVGAVAGPLIGAAIGGSSGSKGSTQTNKPYIPEDREKAYKTQLEDALNLYAKPIDKAPTTRVTPGSGAFGSLFDNPEMQMIQQASDKQYFDSLLAPQATDAAAPNDSGMTSDMTNALVENALKQYAPSNLFKSSATSPESRYMTNLAAASSEAKRYGSNTGDFNKALNTAYTKQTPANYDALIQLLSSQAGKAGQAVKPDSYEVFSQKRAAQGLPPMTPPDYNRMIAGGM